MKIPDLKPILPSRAADNGRACGSTTTPYTFPRGLLLQQDFITPSHELDLIENVFRKQLDWPDRKGRLSLHYGYTFSYKTFGIDEDVPFKEFPDWLVPLIPLLPVREGAEEDVEDPGRLVDLPVEGDEEGENGEARRRKGIATKGRPPDQVCLQYYAPGTGIPPHVDTHSTYDELYALSLGAPVMMQFRRDHHDDDDDDDDDDTSPLSPSAREQTSSTPRGSASRRTQLDIDLPPRSMLCMSSDARLHWTHGIKSRKTDTLPDGTVRARGDRWSITYRWLRKERAFDPQRDPPCPTGPSDYYGAGRESSSLEAGGGQDGKEDGGEDTGARKPRRRRMVRECECGDLALCDTAQRRRGREREYRWKGYEKSGGGALASPAG